MKTQVITWEWPAGVSTLEHTGVSTLEHAGVSTLVLESNQQCFPPFPNSFSGVPSSCVPTLCKGNLKGSVLHHQVCLLYPAQLLLHKSLSVDICQIMSLSCSTSNPACLNTEPVCTPGRLGQGPEVRKWKMLLLGWVHITKGRPQEAQRATEGPKKPSLPDTAP